MRVPRRILPRFNRGWTFLLVFLHAVTSSRGDEELGNVKSRFSLWLKADVGMVTNGSGFVQRWEDQSVHANHAVQTNSICQPKLVDDRMSGQPVVHFNGVTNFLEIAHAASLSGREDLTIFAVVRVEDFELCNAIVSKAEGNRPAPFDFYLHPKTGLPYFFRGNGTNLAYVHGKRAIDVGQLSIVSVIAREHAAVLCLNGTLNGSGPIKVAVHDPGGPIRIGSRDDFEPMLKGDLAELIFVDGAVSDEELEGIHSYLGQKFRIPIVFDLDFVSPQPAVQRLEGQTVTFSIGILTSQTVVNYQWQKNGVDISDATNASYTTSALTLADDESRYRVRVTTVKTNRFSNPSILNVIPDTEPITLTTASFLLHDRSSSAAQTNGSGILPPCSARLWLLGEDPARNVIQCMAQTPDGFLWVGTHGGLARFDGDRFEFFFIGPARLAHARVNALCTDTAGRLWVGTAGRGLFQFHQGEWQELALPPGVDSTILSLHASADGSVWVGTRVGMALYKNEKFSLTGGSLLAMRPIRSIAKSSTAALWTGAGNDAVLLNQGTVAKDINFDRFKSDFVRCVYHARDGSLWAGANAGLIRWQDETFTPFSKASGLPDNSVTAIYEDRRGNLWIGTFGGLCRYAFDKFIVELTAEGDPFDQVFCFFEDVENNLWVGAKNGLYQIRGRPFTTYTTHHGLAHNNVISVYEEGEGAMWIGTWGGGLHCLRGGKITIYSTTKNKVMKNDLVLALQGMREGGIWFGEDYDGGLYFLKDGELQRPKGLGRGAIRTLLEDQSGRLLIGSASAYLSVLENGKLVSYGRDDGLPTNSNRCLLQTQDGRIWVGTEAGLCVWTNGKFTTFTRRNGLSHDQILSLYEDTERTLWVGTALGLNRFKEQGPDDKNPASNFQAYSSRDGLLDDPVLEILEDDFANLWLATRNGVIRVSRTELRALDTGKLSKVSSVTFGKADGMASQVCVGVAKPSAVKSKDGRLWFATTKGLAVTDPKFQMAKNVRPPPVVIREVLADKKVQGTKFNVQSSDSTTLDLPAGRGELEFHYTALSYAAPEKNRFKYKLEGLDADWIDADARHTAFYNNVPPGDYTFRVMAANDDGVWNEIGAHVKISLQPHVWQTWWFKSLLGLTGISLVAMGARSLTKRRMQMKLERLEQQHAVERERTRIAQDMHDDLGAGLTGVLLLTEKARLSATPDNAGTTNREIADSVRELAQNLDALVWAENPRHDTLGRLVSYVTEYAVKFLGKSSIRCRLDVPMELSANAASSEMRHNVYLIVKEALNNIAKYAEATEVWIRIVLDDQCIIFVVEDNGRGFAMSETRALGNGLINMRKRAEAIGGNLDICSAPGKGTRIRLDIPLRR
jgi:ligand-binding sensor domain-containing protein/signal transduction histidine kinase